MREYRLVQVDVFTARALAGNPLAVVLTAEGIADAEMQAIAREMNLSETTFVLPPSRPDCVARVRIFTPRSELPFAGHPTIGTSFVLAWEGLLPTHTSELALEEGIGPVTVRFEDAPTAPQAAQVAWMRHADPSFGPALANRAGIAAALGLSESDLLDAPILVGSTGLPHLYVPLRDRTTVDGATVDIPALVRVFGDLRPPGVFVFALDGEAGAHRVYSRMFAPLDGVPEDPATGSASGPLGAYLVRYGLVPPAPEVQIVSEQGTMMGRQSFIYIRMRVNGGQIGAVEVGGSAVPVLTGTLRLP